VLDRQLDEPEGRGEEGTEKPKDAGGEGSDCYNKEPQGCEDKETPDDNCDCKKVWEQSRRVEFAPGEGKDSLPEDCGTPAEASRPEPQPEVPAHVEDVKEDCPENLWGFHLNAGRPNHFVGAALAWQPLCWLELSGGFGFWPAKSVQGNGERGSYSALSVPLRARFWSGRAHSLIVDLGGGFIQIDVDVETEPVSDNSPTYQRPFGFAGVGYGYRSDDSFRLALLGGVMAMGAISRFEAISEPTIYPELSLGFLW
jgi:hypothetical protein